MHSSVLQNDKYIKHAYETSVDVLSLGRLDEAIQKNDAKAATYETTDEKGAKVRRLVMWPSLTVEQIRALDRSKARSYNDTGKIPFTCIVDPYTEKELQRWSGGTSASTISDAVDEHLKALRKEHGPGLGRSTLDKYRALEADVRETLEKSGVARAMTPFKKAERFAEKEGEAIKAMAEALLGDLTAAAEKELAEAKGLIEAGDVSKAKKILVALKSAFRGRELADRATQMIDEANAE